MISFLDFIDKLDENFSADTFDRQSSSMRQDYQDLVDIQKVRKS